MSVKEHRTKLKEALENHPDLLLSYVCNVSCLLHDRYDESFGEELDKKSLAILSLIFSLEVDQDTLYNIGLNAPIPEDIDSVCM